MIIFIIILANGLCMVSCGKSTRIFRHIGKLINSSEFSPRKNPQQPLKQEDILQTLRINGLVKYELERMISGAN